MKCLLILTVVMLKFQFVLISATYIFEYSFDHSPHYFVCSNIKKGVFCIKVSIL